MLPDWGSSGNETEGRIGELIGAVMVGCADWRPCGSSARRQADGPTITLQRKN